jgi:acyl-CoA dehydrogenase
VQERGLWAAHLPPELGGQGFGQVKLGLMNEILGASIYRADVFGCQAPDSGNSEILALAGHARAEGALALAAARRRAHVGVLDDRARDAGLGPDAAPTRAVRDGDGYVLNGHKWFTSNGSIATS